MNLCLQNPPPPKRKPAASGGGARRGYKLGCTVSNKPCENLAENSLHCKLPCSRDAFEIWQGLPVISQPIIGWLVSHNVPPLALGSGDNSPLKQTESGEIAILVNDESGPLDIALWSARNSTVEAHIGAAWAIGQDEARNPGQTALGGSLRIHESPLQWLQANRRGIVVLHWSSAFNELRHVERVSLPKSLSAAYGQAMKPRLPAVSVEG